MWAYMMWPKTLRRCVDCTLSTVGWDTDALGSPGVVSVGIPVPILLNPPCMGWGTDAGNTYCALQNFRDHTFLQITVKMGGSNSHINICKILRRIRICEYEKCTTCYCACRI